jgi:uroporphyrinogen decarboxylase
MTPTERIEAVLRGQKPDRPPFSFWYHFPPDAASGERAVQAHLDHLETYQPDFLKVMNENPYPHERVIASARELDSLAELSGDHDGFGQQLDLIRSLRRAVGRDILLVTTIFNAWAVLRQIVHPPELSDRNVVDGWLRAAQLSDPEPVQRALRIMASNLARFAQLCITAGADGIFLSVRDDWVDADTPGLYRNLVEPLDRMILAGASAGRLNVLHVCGRALDFRRFAEYPVHVINWADRIAGPAIVDVKDWLRPAICAGVNHERTLPDGSPRDVVLEVADAIQQAHGRPIMIAPGCTFDPARVPKTNLEAFTLAVRESHP